MCGIFGVINGSDSRTVSFPICHLVKDMFIVNTVRGDDSTGLFQIDKKHDAFLYKEPINGAEFVGMEKAVKYINSVDSSIVTVGHNRAATAGIISQENAHPFTHTNAAADRTVVGVHNGTLVDWGKVKDSKDFKVDSDWAMYKLATEGSVDAFEYFRGAFAFVWYDDSLEGVLNMARNAQRPMYFAYVKNRNQMIFSSEPGMMGWVAARNNLDIEFTIYELEVNTHYKFDMDNPRKFTKTALVKEDYKHFYTPSTTKQHKKNKHGNNVSMYDEWDWNNHGSTNSNDSQSKFFNKMDALLPNPKKKGLLILPHNKQEEASAVITMADLEDAQEFGIQDAVAIDLGKNIDGIYETEIDEAKELQLDGMEIACELTMYEEDSKTAFFDFLFPVNHANDCSFFEDIGFVEVRNVPATTAVALSKSKVHHLKIKGIYYDKRLAKGGDVCLVADSKLIADCRKADATYRAANTAA